MAKYKPTMRRKDMKRFVSEVLSGLHPGDHVFLGANTPSAQHVARVCRKWAKRCGKIRTKNTWGWHFARFAKCIETGEKLPYAVFGEKGNIKLPFYNWSTLAEFTCPGAGGCLEYCYSFTGWRYPAALLRQLQNTILIRNQRAPIRAAFRAIPQGLTVRLYVDGDIENVDQLAFWFGLLFQRPDLTVYGYSKSWEVFLDYRAQGLEFPENYVLNISDGSRYDGNQVLADEVARLPITRGGFHAVDVGRIGADWQIKSDTRWQSKDYHNSVRVAAREALNTPKVFSCPGKCGDCHKCGERSFTVPIAIGIHG